MTSRFAIFLFFLDLVVTSGLRFYYDAPRQYDAATMSVGQSNSLSLTIPPKQENWTVSAACVKSCTSVRFTLSSYNQYSWFDFLGRFICMYCFLDSKLLKNLYS